MSLHQYVARSADGCAWITGASSGIGRALALKLAQDGWCVAVTARSENALQEMVTEASDFRGSIVAFPADVTDAQKMQSIVTSIEEDVGPIALLIANAGVYLPQDGLNGRVEEWNRTIDVNLKGTVNALLPVIDCMKQRHKGQIGVVASVAGYRGLPTSAAYGATKAGLINMAEALKFDLDLAGIRIQIINPGFVDTPATKSNPFPMPYLMSADEAVGEIIKGLKDPKAFEIAFPKPFVRQLKFLKALPYSLYFKAVSKSTGWSKKTKKTGP
ncbi:short-chain dehydrogenase/reductase SDR [Roseibium sp. TrichSKD4]|uniref:SDR family NAD(P)-dependent oxidoreductase n=1 Tax=Roseibium sp. TrichSKD4 TaxID=744980 RepID=UPI0001E56308|nr:SDR family NAD(P)-dependent oxidoreductase [Roseibium sp. TrichSKD4]EFO33848.1 short-chain dehydrogenase/reductase SDR [Roseibium sp. TrichSKD4]